MSKQKEVTIEEIEKLLYDQGLGYIILRIVQKIDRDDALLDKKFARANDWSIRVSKRLEKRFSKIEKRLDALEAEFV